MTCKGLKLASLLDLCAETVSSSARHLPVIPPLHFYDSTVFRFTCWIVKGCLQYIYTCVISYDKIRETRQEAFPKFSWTPRQFEQKLKTKYSTAKIKTHSFFFLIIGFNHIAAILDFKLPYEIVWIIITCWFFTWESLLWLDHVEEASSLYNFIVEDEAALLECKVDNISCYVSGWIRYFFKHNKNYIDHKKLFDIFINPNSS
jgi:hypothetical protein